MSYTVTLIDYGMGNLWSVQSVFEYLGAEVLITSDPDKVIKENIIVLPGVGSFRRGMDSLKRLNLDQAIISSVRTGQARVLGICLGMQLLAKSGIEGGQADGLGLIPGCVQRFTKNDLGELKLPHIGFNRVYFLEYGKLFNKLPSGTDFYFVHSYFLKNDSSVEIKATAKYGIEFMAAFEQDNVFATQFHPEKSQTNGLRLLKNFLEIDHA